MRFNQLKNLGIISILIAILVGIFDLFYVVNINIKESYFFMFSIYCMLINIFGITIGFIGLLKNRHNRNLRYYKTGILLNLSLILAKLYIYPYIHNLIEVIFLKASL